MFTRCQVLHQPVEGGTGMLCVPALRLKYHTKAVARMPKPFGPTNQAVCERLSRQQHRTLTDYVLIDLVSVTQLISHYLLAKIFNENVN